MNLRCVGLVIFGLCFAVLASAAGEGAGSSGGGNARVCFTSAETARAVIDEGVECSFQAARAVNRVGCRYIRDKYLADIESITAFDLVQAATPHGWNGAVGSVIEPVNDESADQYIDRILSRWDQTVPVVSDVIRYGRRFFSDKNIFRHEFGVYPGDDSNPTALPESDKCVLATMASQLLNEGRLELHIDDRLYSHPKHSRLSQFVFQIHEYVRKAATDLTHASGRQTWEFVALAIQADSGLTIRETIDEIKRLQFGAFIGKKTWPTYVQRLTQSLFETLLDETLNGHKHFYENEAHGLVQQASGFLPLIYKETSFSGALPFCNSLDSCVNAIEFWLKDLEAGKCKPVVRDHRSCNRSVSKSLQTRASDLKKALVLLSGAYVRSLEKRVRKITEDKKFNEMIEAIPGAPDVLRSKIRQSINGYIERLKKIENFNYEEKQNPNGQRRQEVTVYPKTYASWLEETNRLEGKRREFEVSKTARAWVSTIELDLNYRGSQK